MPKKAYEIVEGTKEFPTVLVAVVKPHLNKYGRLSLPGTWIGKKIVIKIVDEKQSDISAGPIDKNVEAVPADVQETDK